MNKKLFAIAAALVLLTLWTVGSAYAQSDSLFCNNKLITGTYGFTIEGAKLGGTAPLPMVGVAMTQFDGAGNLTQIDTVVVNGFVLADFTHTPATGTYTVNPDCTGTFTINFTDHRPSPVVTNFVVVENGSEIDTVVISVNATQGLLATRSIGKRRFFW